MGRKDVYAAIDSERDYQENLWSNLNKTNNSPSAFILWMEEYLSYARRLASTTDERPGKGLDDIMERIRKVTALGVACMEIHGVKNR
jgi:hypothetical protein